MNPFKNISVFRDKVKEPTELAKMIPTLELLKQENDRLQHLTTVLIEHIWKKHPFPLKEIDEKMLDYDKKTQFDDGGIDGTPRNA